MKPRNDPTNKYFYIDGQILQVVKATPCTEEPDGLPLWNVELSNGLQLEEWYPEYEVGKDKPINTESLDARFDLVQLIANTARDYIKESHKDDINDYDLDYSFILCENSKEINDLCEKSSKGDKMQYNEQIISAIIETTPNWLRGKRLSMQPIKQGTYKALDIYLERIDTPQGASAQLVVVNCGRIL